MLNVGDTVYVIRRITHIKQPEVINGRYRYGRANKNHITIHRSQWNDKSALSVEPKTATATDILKLGNTVFETEQEAINAVEEYHTVGYKMG